MRPERKLPDKIRWAIDYATDRAAISQVYAHGYGRVLYSWLDNSGPYTNDTLEWREYDPDKAKELIQEAIDDGDWDPNRIIQIVHGGEQAHWNIFLNNLQAVGLKAEIRLVGQLYNDIMLAGDYDLTQIWGGAARGHPEIGCSYFLRPEGHWYDRIGYYDEKMVDMCNAGRGTVDEQERKRIFSELIEYYYDTGPWISWSTNVYAWATHKDVCGVVPSAGHPLVHRGGEKYGLFDWYWCPEE
jgi:peptide/nickel transport system substrate-binding protein